MRVLRTLTAFVLALGVCTASVADEIAVSRLDEGPPSELADPVRALLAPAAVRVKIGDSLLDFWWVARLEASSPDWAGIAEGSLVGVVKIASSFRDIRGRSIKAGLYTLRLGIQPANGDHLGVSPHREFLLLSPGVLDTSPQAAGHEGAIALSKATIGGSHPAVLSIDPLKATEPELAVWTNGASHEAVIFQVSTAAGPLRFGVVLVGRIEG
jgi:hypothetical protein